MIGWAGWVHLLLFGLLLPLAAVRSARKLGTLALPPRSAHFRGVIIQQAVWVSISLAVARLEMIPLWVGQPTHPLGILAGAAFLLGGVMVMRPRWRRHVANRVKVVELLMPRSARERLLWVGVSLTAGIGEEITYRGVMTSLLTFATGDVWIATLAMAVAFGISHAVQGWKSVPIIAAIGAAQQGLVWLTGSLLVPMAVHVLYDLAAGFWYGRYGEELGFPAGAAA